MWELDHKKSWAQKNLCFWTVVLEKTLECPLDCNQIHPVHAKGDQSWVFIGRIDVEAETPKLWPYDVTSWFIWKDPDEKKKKKRKKRKDPYAGKDWRQVEKEKLEDKMAGWYHQLNGHEFEWAPGVGNGQGNLACYSPWDQSQTWLSDWTELNCVVSLAFMVHQLANGRLWDILAFIAVWVISYNKL